MTAIQKWLAWLAATFVAVTVSWQWLDRPIATFAHRRTIQYETFAQVTHIPDPFIPAAVIVFLVLGLWIYSGRPLPKLAATALLCGISAIVSDATKALLKYGFGRTWPETWVQNNPSFVRDGVFGFNFFHGGPGYASFPSGHMALTCSVMSVLWVAYPKFRALYASWCSRSPSAWSAPTTIFSATSSPAVLSARRLDADGNLAAARRRQHAKRAPLRRAYRTPQTPAACARDYRPRRRARRG